MLALRLRRKKNAPAATAMIIAADASRTPVRLLETAGAVDEICEGAVPLEEPAAGDCADDDCGRSGSLFVDGGLIAGALPDGGVVDGVVECGRDAGANTALRPDSVSRFRRCRSARISAACW